MIQLHHHLCAQAVILLGKVLQEYQGYELGYFYAELDEVSDVVIRLYLPGNGHYVGLHPAVQFFQGQKANLETLQRLAEDYNALLNLSPPAEGLSNTR